MPIPRAHSRHGRSPASTASIQAIAFAVLLGVLAAGPVAAADPTIAPEPAHPAGVTGGTASSTTAGTLSVALTQSALSYDAATNKAQVRVTVTPTDAAAPWSWSIAVRGTVVTSGTSSDASISATVTNNCSITTQSVTTSVTDNGGATASAAATLDRSLCPPPPDVPHAKDHILAGPTLTEDSFVDRLRAVSSPALSEGRSIYRTLVASNVNPAFALGTFHAESHSGTRGYAVTTKNWGNILYYSWEAAYGATPYAPGNGYTYAKYPTWLASVQAYAALLVRYDAAGYTTVSSASAHWLGTIEGSTRHLTYLNNIVGVMSILPDDAVPVMTALHVPVSSRAPVVVSWSARDNLAVTGYYYKYRKGSGAWSALVSTTAKSASLPLTTGTWQVAVRALDGAGNASHWLSGYVRVDSGIPVLTSLRASQTVVRTVDGRFTAAWGGSDNIGVTRYQWRTRRSPDGAPSAVVSTTRRYGAFAFAVGSWFLDVRAVDAVGNASPWRTVHVFVPRDDRSFTFSAGTTRRTGSTFYRGTLTTTRVKGATLTTSTTGGDAFVLIGRVGPNYGKLVVTVDGVSKTIDTAYLSGKRVTQVHDRVVLFSVRLGSGAHTVTIRNLATTGRPTIAIDGLGFLR